MKRRFFIFITVVLSFQLYSSYLFSESEHEQIYNSGITQFQNGDYKNAIDSFDIVISTASSKEKDLLRKSYLAKADSLLGLLQLDSAKSEYEKIVEKFPKTAESTKAKLGIGLIYYKKNLYDRGREYLIYFIKRYSDTKLADDAQYWLGMLHFKNKNFKKASISFTTLVQNYPKSNFITDGWLRLGDCYYELKKYKQARNSYRKILNNFTSNPQYEFALYNIGRTYESEGATDDPITIYEQFIEKYPKSAIVPETIYQVAGFFYRRKNYDKSNKYFDQLSTNFPEHDLSEEAKFMRSKIFYITGNRTEAITSFKSFLDKYSLSKNCSEALLYIGNCFFDSADYPNAI